MKIGSIQNNHVNSIKSKKHRVSFRSGLPNSFVEYVKHADVNKITTKLSNMGFLADFKGCKTVAACTEKTVEIFKKYNLSIPKSLTFEPIQDKYTAGSYYSILKHVTINSDIKNFYDINLLNKMEESQNYFHPTKHFLATFIHEFSHNAHYENIIKNHGLEKANAIWDELHSRKITAFWAKFYNGNYSKENMLEYMSETITKKIASNLDENLNFINYPKLGFVKRIKSNDFRYDMYGDRYTLYDKNIFEAMKITDSAIWNGDIEFLYRDGFGIKGQINFKEINSYFNTAKQFKELLKG